MAILGFDELHLRPADRVAKNVMYNDGDYYEACVKSNTHLFSTLPLPIRKPEGYPFKLRNDPSFKDYTGFRFGSFVVIGMFALDKFDKWVCRCACGNYEVRRTSILNKNPTSIPQTRCQECMDTQRIKNKDYFMENGHYPWEQPRKNKKRKFYGQSVRKTGEEYASSLQK